MRAIMDRGRAIHLSSHSFASELDGKPRRADIGLLYDPARAAGGGRTSRFVRPISPFAEIYPYVGKNDGLTAWFRRRRPPSVCAGNRRIAVPNAHEPLCGSFRVTGPDKLKQATQTARACS